MSIGYAITDREAELYRALYAACRGWQMAERTSGATSQATDDALQAIWKATNAIKSYVDGPDDATPRSSGSDPVRDWATKNEWRWRR